MLIVDTGVVVAAADRRDRRHVEASHVLRHDRGPLVTTAMVIAECAHLMARVLGPAAEAALYPPIISGELRVEHLEPSDWRRVHDLVVRYDDLPLGGTDA